LQVEHLFVVESAKVPKGQFAEITQVFVFELRKVFKGHDVQVIASNVHVSQVLVH
jgi:hypothetical protein